MVACVNDAIAKLVKEADVVQAFSMAGIEGLGGGPVEYARLLECAAERNAKAIRTAEATAE